MLEQEVGAIIGLCHSLFPDYTPIIDELPSPAPIKAIYFPPPNAVSSSAFTSAAYERSYLLNARVFGPSSSQAHGVANQIAEAIERKRYAIPKYDIDGSEIARKLIIEDVSFQLIDTRVAALDFTWQSRYMFDIAQYEKMLNLYVRQEG